MNKRIKMSLSDVINLDISYHAFQRISKTDAKLKGYRYILSEPLTSTQVKAIKHFKNTQLSTCHYRDAPEKKYNTLILWDRCIKEEGALI